MDALTSLVRAQRPLSLLWPSSARIDWRRLTAKGGRKGSGCNRAPGSTARVAGGGFQPEAQPRPPWQEPPSPTWWADWRPGRPSGLAAVIAQPKVVILRGTGLIAGMKIKSVVLVDPEILGGTPCFAGTRVPARILFEYLEGGDSLDEFLADFPTVSRAQAVALLTEASERLALAPA